MPKKFGVTVVVKGDDTKADRLAGIVTNAARYDLTVRYREVKDKYGMAVIVSLTNVPDEDTANRLVSIFKQNDGIAVVM